MSLLRVTLFKNLRVVSDAAGPLDLGSLTTRSLFAYLLLNRSQPSDRQRLAGLFWPGSEEKAARRNLRQYLHRLRRALEAGDVHSDLIRADTSSVQITPDSQVWVDVEAFLYGTRPEATLDEIQTAVSLYTGDLLEECYEDWCRNERERLREHYLYVLDLLIERLKLAGNYRGALAYAQKWVRKEPLDEAAHRKLMILYHLMGERHRAVLQHQILTETLQEELNTSPSPDTDDLLHSIQEGEYSSLLKTPVSRLKPPHFPDSQKVPLIGRQLESEQYNRMVDGASQMRGGFAIITGESGIGKTRLLQESIHTNQNANVLWVGCRELETGVPFAPFRRLLSAVMEESRVKVLEPYPEWLVSQPGSLEAPRERSAQDVQVSSNWDSSPGVDVLTDLLIHLCQQTRPPPLLLVIDDLHWADYMTWELLVRLSQRLGDLPFLIIGLCRLEDLPVDREPLIRSLMRNDLLRHIPMERLTYEETSQLAGHLLPMNKLDRIFLRRLYQETEGNPFFIIETVRAIRESGHTLRMTQDWRWRDQTLRIPISIQRLIEGRLDRLSSKSREVLAIAATIGQYFTLAMLQDVSQIKVEEIIPHIEEWTQRGLVREGLQSYDFSHEKIRQVAYASLSRARRQFIHRCVAEMLERSIPPADLSTLAHHYALSDQPLKALPYLASAGEQALRAHSYQEARQFGLRAVSLLGRMPGPQQRGERIDLNLQLAQAYAFTGELLHAQEILSQAEQLAVSLGDPSRLGNVFYRAAQVFWLRGRPEPAGDYARRARRVAEESDDPQLLSAALRMLGRVGIALSTFDDAIANLLRCINLEEAASLSSELPALYGYLGVAYARVGSWQRAWEAGLRGHDMAREGGSVETVAFTGVQLAFIYADYRDWQRCAEVLASIPEPFENDQQLPPYGFMLLGLKGLTKGYTGELERGIEILRRALDWAERTDYRVFHYLPRIFLSDCLIRKRDFQAAESETQRALDKSTAAGDRWARGITLRQRAEIMGQAIYPDWSRIENHLIESMQLLRQVRARPDLARTYLALRKLYDRAGQIAWAVDCHYRATSIFDELGMLAELRHAQGQAAGERLGGIVIPDMVLRGPNRPATDGGST